MEGERDSDKRVSLRLTWPATSVSLLGAAERQIQTLREVSVALQSPLATPLERLEPRLRALVALLDPQCTADQAAGWLSSGPDLLGLARKHGVLPLVFRRWEKVILGSLGKESSERWRNCHHGAVALACHRRAYAVEVLRALREAGVEVIVFRGLWLAEAVYQDIALRPHVDVDLIVPPEASPLVQRVMASLGFSGLSAGAAQRVADGGRERLRRGQYCSLGSYTRLVPGVGSVNFDFHPTLHVVSTGWWAWRPDPEELAARSEPWQLEGVPCRALQRHVALIAASENLVRHALAREPREERLIGYFDALRLSALLTPQEWKLVARDAAEWCLNTHVWAVLAKTKEWWGYPGPEQLAQVGGTSRRGARLALLALKRPWWLGHRGRLALFHACTAPGLAGTAAFLIRNAPPAMLTPRRMRIQGAPE